MKRGCTLALILFVCCTYASAQKINKLIREKEVLRIEKKLSADDMEGRRVFSPGIEKAAAFIAREFRKAGLKYFDTLSSYRQSFEVKKASLLSANGNINSHPVSADRIMAISTAEQISIDEHSDFEKIKIDSSANLLRKAYEIINEQKKAIVWVPSSFKKDFPRLSRFNRESFEEKPPVLFVLTDEEPVTYRFEIHNEVIHKYLSNVAGMLPGKSRKDELVIFSAHYDHLGIGKPDAKGDSIYNGANDDAAGTTAVIMLAKYFSRIKDHERTLVFVAFTGEEEGGFGSHYFSEQTDPEKVVAMFNIEMIGTDSKWGKNSAYITGYDRSDFGKILQENLKGTSFHFEPDPYPDQNLFYRSDNATLAVLGVPAHTISTSKMDNEPNYHKQSDEISTLDLTNMTEIIKAIALSSRTIVNGTATPSRVQKK